MSAIPGTGHAQQQDLGAYTKRVVALNPQTATAAVGTGTEVQGAAVNRVDPSVALGVVVALPARFTMASGNDSVVTRRVDHRASSAEAWAQYGEDLDDLTVTANNDGSALDTDLGFSLDLSGAKAEIRLAVKPNFSASGVDTAVFGGTFVFGGYDTNPTA